MSYRTARWCGTLTLVFALLSIVVATAGALTLDEEPIAYVGHGAAFDRNGKQLPLSVEFVRRTQAYYLENLSARLPADQRRAYERLRDETRMKRKPDTQSGAYADGLLIDWLLQRVGRDSDGSIAGKNQFLKRAIRSRLFPGTLKAADLQLTPLSGGVAKFATTASGQAYIDECANAGVPIPPDWGSSQWQNNGALSNVFISQSLNARVFYFESASPAGVCYALPRDDGSDIVLLGIICMGRSSSKVCFWDNQENDSGFDIPLGDSVPLTDFAGGGELLGGSGGVCTGCHAGENPFVIHPGSALDLSGLGIDTVPNAWYDPMVHPNWPQNAGPLTIFDGVAPAPGEQQCTSCHVGGAGNAGRFPKISTLLNGGAAYCGAVLAPALAQTMPPGSPGDPDYANQRDALQALCSAPTSPVLRFEETVLDFKEVELGFSFTKALVIHNDGDAPLTVTVTAPTVAADADVPQWTTLETANNQTLDPGDPPLVLRQVYTPTQIATHTIQLQVTSNDTTTPAQAITLTGEGRTPVPIDTMLVLDRSGSMADAVGDRRKIDALRDAASLYADLLRDDIGGTGSGDKLGFVKYNDANNLYLPMALMSPAHRDAINNDKLADAALSDSARLNPEGYTGIGGAMQTAAFQFGGAPADRNQVMVVLTDGIENREPWINDVITPIRTTFPALAMYSVGLGDSIEPTKLQNITNVSTGYHQVAATLSDTTLFDLETFYFKIFANAAGMDLVVDPTHVVNLTAPGTILIDSATIVSSDRSANFLIMDDPVLRDFYDIEFVSPTGAVIVPGSTIGGIPVQESKRHTYRIYRVVFPDLNQADQYVGDWLVRLTPNGKWKRELIKERLGNSPIQYSGWLSPYEGLVPVGFAAAVASDYKLQVALLPSSYLPGANVLLTATLSDRGWPAPDGKVEVTVSSPTGATHQLTLHDDGTHGDQSAGDAIWSNHFLQTATPDVYKFYFRSIGHNERGELAPREATRYLTLMQPEPNPPRPVCFSCIALRWILALLLLLLLAMWYCSCFRKRG
jgi:hypothetical protein